MLIHNDTRQTAGMAEGHLTSEGCKKEMRSKPLQPKWEMSCAVCRGNARLEITPTIHNIVVYFLCQLRDKQQDDYKGNNKPTEWNSSPTHPAVSFDIKVRFTAKLFKSCIEPQRRKRTVIKFILCNWKGNVILSNPPQKNYEKYFTQILNKVFYIAIFHRELAQGKAILLKYPPISRQCHVRLLHLQSYLETCYQRGAY